LEKTGTNDTVSVTSRKNGAKYIKAKYYVLDLFVTKEIPEFVGSCKKQHPFVLKKMLMVLDDKKLCAQSCSLMKLLLLDYHHSVTRLLVVDISKMSATNG
jgi:hypothetical protein